jgi:uncharacterized membrane protein YhdT
MTILKEVVRWVLVLTVCALIVWAIVSTLPKDMPL